MSTESVTRHEFELAMTRIDARFERLESAFDRLESRTDSKFAESAARIDARIEAATVTSIRWTVGMALGLYALMFGLILFVISRELPH